MIAVGITLEAAPHVVFDTGVDDIGRKVVTAATPGQLGFLEDGTQYRLTLLAADIGQAAESNVAQAVTCVRRYAIGQAVELDQPQPMTLKRVRPVAVAIVSESDSAQAVVKVKAAALSIAQESDVAQSVGVAFGRRIDVDQASHTETAQAISSPTILRGVGQAASAHAAHQVSSQRLRLIARADQNSAAHALTAAKRRPVGQAQSISIARAITRKLSVVSQAFEIDMATALQGLAPEAVIEENLSLTMVEEEEIVLQVAV